MSREIELGRGVVVAPRGLLESADREIDAGRATVFVVYPDSATGSELAEILKAAAELARIEKGNTGNT